MKNMCGFAESGKMYEMCQELSDAWFAGEKFWTGAAAEKVSIAKNNNTPIPQTDMGVFLVTGKLEESVLSACKRFYCFNKNMQIGAVWDPIKEMYRYALTGNEENTKNYKYVSLMDFYSEGKQPGDLFNFASRMGAFPTLGDKTLCAVINNEGTKWRYTYEHE